MDIREIHRDFSNTEYGERLRGRIRWEKYRPEHVSRDEWMQILGNDASALDHMLDTYKITKVFVNRDNNTLQLSNDDKNTLELAAIMHDWGDSGTFDEYDDYQGVNYEDKTTDDLEYEQKQFQKVCEKVYGPDIKEMHLLLSVIFSNPESRLSRIFTTIEQIGYLRTAIRALIVSEQTDDPVLRSHLQWLCAGVLSNQTVPLLEAAADYLPAKKYLSITSQYIDTAFQTIDTNIFTLHGQGKTQEEQFVASKVIWSRQVSQQKKSRPYSLKNETIFDQTSNYEVRIIRDDNELREKIEALRSLGLSIVLTSGSFDLMHIGHMKYLEKAKSMGDILLVGVDSDARIQKRKGPNRPVVEEEERLKMLAHVRNVDLITIKKTDTEKWQLIKLVRPDILVVTAETYTPQDIEELERLYCKRVLVLEPQATTSTSARIRRLSIGQSQLLIEPIIEACIGGKSEAEIREIADVAIRNA